MDAAFAAIEAQKKGDLHVHAQLFVQCLHQHKPLAEVKERLREKGDDLVKKYLVYKTHVCRQQYANVDAAKENLIQREKEWPEYETSKFLVSQPSYLQKRPDASINMDSDTNKAKWNTSEALTTQLDEAIDWKKTYLQEHVQAVQEHRQHHVHIWNDKKGMYMPLTHCQRKDDPTKCKADFPRTRWLVDRLVILCPGLCNQMGMQATGRRSKLGSLHGPMNHESLNGSHPAMLAAQVNNSDVQLPYRFPITPETHNDDICKENCCDNRDDATIVQAAQMSQDAQAGYARDYCNKRQPMAYNEVKECCKGHEDLSEQIRGEPLSVCGKRHMTRLMSDSYGKGVVRSQTECTLLRTAIRGMMSQQQKPFEQHRQRASSDENMSKRLND